jgi:uncharacterized membrane protein
MGNESWKLAGPYVGTYIGGSLNFFSLWTGLEIGNQDLLAAANAVDNMTVVPIFAFWILVTERIRRFFPIGEFWKTGENEEERDRVKEVPHRLSIKEITILSLCALSIIALSNWINDRLIAVVFEGLPTILIITTFALIVAQLPFARKLKGAGELGNLSFYFFFAAVGAMIDIVKAVSLAPILFLYVMIIIALQILLALLIGRLFKLDIRMLAVGSIAAKCGPPTVIAITNVMEWKRLLLPGIAVALLGYAIGNYIGFGAAYLIKFLLGM